MCVGGGGGGGAHIHEKKTSQNLDRDTLGLKKKTRKVFKDLEAPKHMKTGYSDKKDATDFFMF